MAKSIYKNSKNNSPSCGFNQSEAVQQRPILHDPKGSDPRIITGVEQMEHLNMNWMYWRSMKDAAL